MSRRIKVYVILIDIYVYRVELQIENSFALYYLQLRHEAVAFFRSM